MNIIQQSIPVSNGRDALKLGSVYINFFRSFALYLF